MNWDRVKISDCVLKVSNVNPSLVYNENLFKYVDIASIDNNTKTIGEVQYITGNSAPSRARQVLEEGDVLVSTVRPNLNAVALVSKELNGAIGSTGFCVLRPINNTLHPKYLFYWVRSQSFISEMEKKATGASYPAVSDSIIKNSEIPLPPLPIQRQISDTLDKADALRRKGQELLDKYDELAQAIFYEMFGDPVKNEKRWEVKKLEEISYIFTGGTPSRSTPEYFTGDIPWITTVALNNYYISKNNAQGFITEDAIKNSSSKKVKPGSLCFGIRVGVGKCSITQTEICINQDIAGICDFSKHCSSFFLRSVIISYSKYFKSIQKGATIKGVTTGDLRELKIILPDLASQFLYEKKIKCLIMQVESLTKNKINTEKLFKQILLQNFS